MQEQQRGIKYWIIRTDRNFYENVKKTLDRTKLILSRSCIIIRAKQIKFSQKRKIFRARFESNLGRVNWIFLFFYHIIVKRDTFYCSESCSKKKRCYSLGGVCPICLYRIFHTLNGSIPSPVGSKEKKNLNTNLTFAQILYKPVYFMYYILNT